MDKRERGGAGGRLGGPFPPREQVARAGRAAWRHSAATVATVEKMTHRYYRRSMTGSTGQSIKTGVCYFIWALKQVQKFYKNSGRLIIL